MMKPTTYYTPREKIMRLAEQAPAALADHVRYLEVQLAEALEETVALTEQLGDVLHRLKALHGQRLEGEPKPIDNKRFFTAWWR